MDTPSAHSSSPSDVYGRSEHLRDVPTFRTQEFVPWSSFKTPVLTIQSPVPDATGYSPRIDVIGLHMNCLS
jgi:hypothetical protein